MDMRYSHDGCFCGDQFCAGCDHPDFSDACFDGDFHKGEQDDHMGDELCEYYGGELLTVEQLAALARHQALVGPDYFDTHSAEYESFLVSIGV